VLQLDPGRTDFDLHFNVFGVPVRVHPYFWLATFILGYGSGNPTAILVWVIAVFVSILIHELGHAFVMRYFGLRPRVVLYHMGGLAIASEEGQSWQPKSQNTTLQSIVISLAGPGAGFLFAGLLACGIILAGGKFIFTPFNLQMFTFWAFRLPAQVANNLPVLLLFHDLFYINFFWGLVNLLPVIPLDGGQVSRALLTDRFGHKGLGYALQFSCAVAGTVAVVSFLILNDTYLAIMFVLLAVSSFQTWQQVNSRFS
jgi:Zn-dependent protease